MIIVPFEVGHLESFKPGKPDRIAMDRWGFESRAGEFVGSATSGIENGRVLGIAGLSVHNNEALAWIFASDDLRARAVTMHRPVYRILRAALSNWNLARIVAEVPEEFDACHRWVGRLGFRMTEKCDGFTRYEMVA